MQKKFCRGLLSLALTGIALLAYAQNPLKIGDALPKQFWETPLQMVNTPQKTTTLSADKDKLIVLDFWATWCGSCLKNFPKMEALQKQFGDRIKILPVTDQKTEVLQKFFSSANGGRYNKTASVKEDQMLHGFFPHNGIPYIVWIKDGRLINTTDADQVSADAVSELLENKKSSLQTIHQIDRSRPFMLSKDFDSEKASQLLAYSFISKGRIRSVGYGTYFHRSASGSVYGRQFTNLSLMDIYRAIGYALFEKKGDLFSEKRLIVSVKDINQVDFNTAKEGLLADQKIYSMDYITPPSQSDRLYENMLKFINQNTPYSAEVSDQAVKCLVLRRTSDKDRICTKGGEVIDQFMASPSVLQNVSLDYMLSALNANSAITALPVIDETGYRGNVDLRLNAFKDLAQLQKSLARYDLELKEATRQLPIMMIKDSNTNNR
ncbi:TlpA family protein disulfide reductase [Chryseobacterium sp. NEB161]|nr:TlpA family protein disulfide reductase [Chryseobacterium sp. NEB161]